MGIREIGDVRARMDAARQELTNGMEALQTSRQEVEALRDEFARDIEEDREGFRSELAAGSADNAAVLASSATASGQIASMRDDIVQTEDEVRALTAQIGASLEQLQMEMTAVRSFQDRLETIEAFARNQSYRVSVTYSPAIPSGTAQSMLDDIRTALATAGFSIDPRDTLPLGVERNEIVAFSAEGVERARRVRDALRPIVDLELREDVVRSQTRAYEIQLNIRAP